MPRCKHLVILKPASPTEPKEVTCKLNVLKRESSVKRLCTGCKSFTLKKARPKLASRKKNKTYKRAGYEYHANTAKKLKK